MPIWLKSGRITISIHAPARGATFPAALAALPPYYFNPRPREGGDCSW